MNPMLTFLIFKILPQDLGSRDPYVLWTLHGISYSDIPDNELNPTGPYNYLGGTPYIMTHSICLLVLHIIQETLGQTHQMFEMLHNVHSTMSVIQSLLGMIILKYTPDTLIMYLNSLNYTLIYKLV